MERVGFVHDEKQFWENGVYHSAALEGVGGILYIE